jgi:hypothetical protein
MLLAAGEVGTTVFRTEIPYKRIADLKTVRWK